MIQIVVRIDCQSGIKKYVFKTAGSDPVSTGNDLFKFINDRVINGGEVCIDYMIDSSNDVEFCKKVHKVVCELKKTTNKDPEIINLKVTDGSEIESGTLGTQDPISSIVTDANNFIKTKDKEVRSRIQDAKSTMKDSILHILHIVNIVITKFQLINIISAIVLFKSMDKWVDNSDTCGTAFIYTSLTIISYLVAELVNRICGKTVIPINMDCIGEDSSCYPQVTVISVIASVLGIGALVVLRTL